MIHKQIHAASTAVYVKKALEQWGKVDYFSSEDVGKIDRNYDYYIAVDDGRHYFFPQDLHPSAFWAIDIHITPMCDGVVGTSFDRVFCAHPKGARILQNFGLANVQWLPLGCDEQVHVAKPEAKKYDIGFVGNIGKGKRGQMLEAIKQRYPNSHIGTADFREMASIYAQSRIVFNHSLRGDVNMRLFEGTASGTVVLTDRVEGLQDLFQEDVDLLAYSSQDEAFKKIDLLLADASMRDRIGRAGQEKALTEHTYKHRVATMLSQMDRPDLTANHLGFAFNQMCKLSRRAPFMLRSPYRKPFDRMTNWLTH